MDKLPVMVACGVHSHRGFYMSVYAADTLTDAENLAVESIKLTHCNQDVVFWFERKRGSLDVKVTKYGEAKYFIHYTIGPFYVNTEPTHL